MMLSRTRFGLSQARKRPELYVRAIGDRLLCKDQRIRYLLFMDIDEPFSLSPEACRVFLTENGFHAIGNEIVSLEEKSKWSQAWHELYPDCDYPLRSFCWLMPHTPEECLYILELASTVCKPEDIPLSEYYRDKAVLEVIA